MILTFSFLGVLSGKLRTGKDAPVQSDYARQYDYPPLPMSRNDVESESLSSSEDTGGSDEEPEMPVSRKTEQEQAFFSDEPSSVMPTRSEKESPYKKLKSSSPLPERKVVVLEEEEVDEDSVSDVDLEDFQVPATVQINTMDVKNFKVLTGSNNMTLYAFKRDTKDESKCSGDCLVKWPPLLASSINQIKLGQHIQKKLVNIYKLNDGRLGVSYNGMPLYYYIEDKKPGDINGQNVGQVWFMVSSSGKMLQPTKPITESEKLQDKPILAKPKNPFAPLKEFFDWCPNGNKSDTNFSKHVQFIRNSIPRLRDDKKLEQNLERSDFRNALCKELAEDIRMIYNT